MGFEARDSGGYVDALDWSSLFGLSVVKWPKNFPAQVEGRCGNGFVVATFSRFVDGAEDGEELAADWGEAGEWNAGEVGR